MRGLLTPALLLLLSHVALAQRRPTAPIAPAPAQKPQSCAAFDGVDMCGYQSHRELTARMRQLERQFPSLAQVGSLGQSVEGRELAYVKVSANVR